MKIPLLTVQIHYERDVVLSRQRARQLAGLLGFEHQDRVRIATTISELARNVFQYAKRGKIEFACDTGTGAMEVVISDQGPGIANLKEILRGEYVSETGMGVGLAGAKRLMDEFHIETAVGKGTTITISKSPGRGVPLTPKRVEEIVSELATNKTEDPFQEIQRQNQELLATMEELQKQQSELNQLNRELEDTNRGVMALYAELDEKADYLRRASEIKSRFLSNMTHEFRTPLNSILGLSRMLLDRTDGELTFDQEKQVFFIRRAASDLSELVNDLLDLSKVEAGKIVIRPSEFEIKDMFGALRGMLRPLLAHNSSISLVFDEAEGFPPLFTDESKVSQILRNFISNAIKFTEKGEVRISAALRPDNTIHLSVRDTGIGIANGDLLTIFEEFTQIEGPHQKKFKGTGLGLSLSKKLAEVLGGSVSVESELGVGSTFSVTLPLQYGGEVDAAYLSGFQRQLDPHRTPVLVVDDNPETLFIYESYLKNTPFQAIPVRSIRAAREALEAVRPIAIFLDVLLGHESSWAFLAELKRDKRTREIPVCVVTVVENEAKARQEGADAFHLKPIDREWLLSQLHSRVRPQRLLLIDDDEVSRYLFRSLLSATPFQMIEAVGGREGIETALEERPDVIFLDLDMPGMNGFETRRKLQEDSRTRHIPIVFYTANLQADDKLEEFEGVVGILSKDLSSREVAQAKLMTLMGEIKARIEAKVGAASSSSAEPSLP
ncbi:Signal transduction histidine kinase [Verrucomicrobium sp. GAS474]|uniref:ATP-binding protein n=1 Tax=Verrucomicrobium sp. GAS474 TaxID=1882831 RepID=UPI00087D9A47|nr:ATP-binding protein [Verrucomicrobium sp. GAS474]SDU03202.1 Signal transduction histidine kinase [Verrucomicrobium sp. GAS474]